MGGACPNFAEKNFADDSQTTKFVNISPSKVSRYTVYIMIQYLPHAAHTEVQLLVGQILMNFAMCDESRPFLHAGPWGPGGCDGGSHWDEPAKGGRQN